VFAKKRTITREGHPLGVEVPFPSEKWWFEIPIHPALALLLTGRYTSLM